MGNLDNLEAFNEMDRGSVDKQRKLIRALTMPYETVYGVSMDTGLCTCYRMSESMNEFAVAFKDINEEKKLEIAQQQRIEEAVEEARRANRAKTVFLSNMSHDIRTSMNGIIGMTAI